MKKLILAVLGAGALMVNQVNAQDTVAAQTKAHVKGTAISTRMRTRPKPVVNIEESPVQGIIPRATRVDQPLQMLNPLAPREYGNGSEFVSGYNDDPGQGPKNQKNNGAAFKLFSVEF